MKGASLILMIHFLCIWLSEEQAIILRTLYVYCTQAVCNLFVCITYPDDAFAKMCGIQWPTLHILLYPTMQCVRPNLSYPV